MGRERTYAGSVTMRLAVSYESSASAACWCAKLVFPPPYNDLASRAHRALVASSDATKSPCPWTNWARVRSKRSCTYFFPAGFWSPRSPWPLGATVFAFVRRSALKERLTLSCDVVNCPSASRRTYRLSPLFGSISSRFAMISFVARLPPSAFDVHAQRRSSIPNIRSCYIHG